METSAMKKIKRDEKEERDYIRSCRDYISIPGITSLKREHLSYVLQNGKKPAL